MFKLVKYVLIDILRNKILLGYTLVMLLLSCTLFNVEDNAAKGLLGLLNLVLIIIPLVSIVFSTIYVYNSSEFIELLVSQPLQRISIWLSVFYGLAIAMVIAFLIGVAVPVLLFKADASGFMLIATGILLSIIFVAIAMLASVYTRDKAKGIGTSVILWLYFTLLFDGLVLFLLFQFSDFPLEKPMIAVSALNPVDLSRILILLHMDASALMGYTGAVFKDFFGTITGSVFSFGVLTLWVIIPTWLSVRAFKRKDL
jgi:Cu-processing system permease protein